MSDFRPLRPDAIPIANPFVGILSVVAGTVLAVALVPGNHRPEGVLFASSLCMAAGLLFAPGMAVIMCPRAAFRVEHLLMLGLTYWLLLDHLQGAYDMEDVKRPAVIATFGAIGLFACAIWAAAFLPPWRLPGVLEQTARMELGATFLFGALLACTALALFKFAWPCDFDVVLMVKSLSGNRWSAPWARGALGGWDSFRDHLQYFGYLVPTLVVLLAYHTKSWSNALVLIGILLTVPVTVFVAHGGSRRVIGVMFGSAMVCWALMRGRAIRLPTLAGLAGAAALLLIGMQLMLEYRVTGYSKLLGAETRHEAQFDHLHVDDNFLRLAQVIEIIPDRHPYTYEKVFVWVAVRPIPRVFWEGKPVDPGFDLAETVGKVGVSLSCSAIGELFVSFGWPAVALGGWLFGRFAGTCNRFLAAGYGQAGILMYSAGTMALFAGLRSMLELVLMSYMIVAWCGIVVLMRFFGYGMAVPRAGVR